MAIGKVDTAKKDRIARHRPAVDEELSWSRLFKSLVKWLIEAGRIIIDTN